MKKDDIIVKQAQAFNDKLVKILQDALQGKKRANVWINVGDIADLIKYCNLIGNLNFRKAQIMQQNLDTSVYEYIPDSLWENIEYGKF